MNRLDQVVRLLREQLREIEQEERALATARRRIEKALGQFAKSGEHLPPLRGTRRSDSTSRVRQIIEEHFMPGETFTRPDLFRFTGAGDDPLREFQASGGLRRLIDTGIIESLKVPGKRGVYRRPEPARAATPGRGLPAPTEAPLSQLERDQDYLGDVARGHGEDAVR